MPLFLSSRYPLWDCHSDVHKIPTLNVNLAQLRNREKKKLSALRSERSVTSTVASSSAQQREKSIRTLTGLSCIFWRACDKKKKICHKLLSIDARIPSSPLTASLISFLSSRQVDTGGGDTRRTEARQQLFKGPLFCQFFSSLFYIPDAGGAASYD